MVRVHNSTTSNQGNSTIKIVRMSNLGGNNTLFDQYKLSRATNFGAWKFSMNFFMMHEMLV